MDDGLCSGLWSATMVITIDNTIVLIYLNLNSFILFFRLLMSELIPNNVKGFSSGLVTSFNFICMFIITLEFQALADLIDFKFIYLALSLISFSSVFFVYFFLPESKGKSLAEIEEYFRQRNVNYEQES